MFIKITLTSATKSRGIARLENGSATKVESSLLTATKWFSNNDIDLKASQNEKEAYKGVES